MGVVYRNGDVGLFLKGLAVLFFFSFYIRRKPAELKTALIYHLKRNPLFPRFSSSKEKQKIFFFLFFFCFLLDRSIKILEKSGSYIGNSLNNK